MGRRWDDINDGTVQKNMAVFWFTLLGYMAAIVTLEVIAEAVGSMAISVTAKLSYVFIFFWLQARINDAAWWIKPEYHPKHDFSSKKENFKVLSRGGRISAIFCIAIYTFVEHAIGLISTSGHV